MIVGLDDVARIAVELAEETAGLGEWGSTILIGGRMCAGKTTFAGAVSRRLMWAGYDVYRTSFAKPMKRAYKNDKDVSGDLLTLLIQSYVFPAWAAHYTDEQDKLLGEIRRTREEMTKREFYQYFATDVIRKHKPNAFPLWALERIKGVSDASDGGIVSVIDDWRFENELEVLSILDQPDRRVFTVWVEAKDSTRWKRGCNSKNFGHASEKLDPESVRIDYWLVNDDEEWKIKEEKSGAFKTVKAG